MNAPAFNVYWSTLKATHETCPPGYHRPYDGPINVSSAIDDIAAVTDSEIRHSLFHNILRNIHTPSTINCMWGYYADGFFDRREITNRPGIGSNKYVVSATDRNNAYIGRLFYNAVHGSEKYGASLFFPIGGHRNGNAFTGNLLFDSFYDGNYWISSSGGNAKTLIVYNDRSHPYQSPKTQGNMIRCVRDN